MTKFSIPAAILFVFCSALALLSPRASARLLRLHRESRLWVRLIGIFGLAFVALRLLTEQSLDAFYRSSYWKTIFLEKVRSNMAGVCIGLCLAFITENFDRRSKD